MLEDVVLPAGHGVTVLRHGDVARVPVGHVPMHRAHLEFHETHGTHGSRPPWPSRDAIRTNPTPPSSQSRTALPESTAWPMHGTVVERVAVSSSEERAVLPLRLCLPLRRTPESEWCQSQSTHPAGPQIRGEGHSDDAATHGYTHGFCISTRIQVEGWGAGSTSVTGPVPVLVTPRHASRSRLTY